MNFTAQFRCDNAAFDDKPSVEIARVLRWMADVIDLQGAITGLDQTIHDRHGNQIGEYSLKPDSEASVPPAPHD